MIYRDVCLFFFSLKGKANVAVHSASSECVGFRPKYFIASLKQKKIILPMQTIFEERRKKNCSVFKVLLKCQIVPQEFTDTKVEVILHEILDIFLANSH